MNNDTFDPPKAFIQPAQRPCLESPPRICKDNHTIVNQPPPFDPLNLNVSTPALGGSNGPRAPEPVTLQERHQSTFRQVHTLQAQNAKLYDDNCRLVNTINMLNDRLTFFAAPQSMQVQHYTDVQQKLRASEESRALLSRKYQELLQCIPAGSAQHYLSLELQALQDAYAALDRDYRLLREKYVRLKTFPDQNRVVQQHPQANPQGPVRGPVPSVRSEITQPWTPNAPFRVLNQSPNISTSSTSAIPQGLVDQGERHRRRSSEGFVAPSSLRSGPTPIATSWATPLPTPPPSAPLPGSHFPQSGFPVPAPVPAGSLRPPHHAQAVHDPQSRRPMMPSVPEQLRAAINLYRRSGEVAHPASNQPVSCSPQIPILTSSDSSPRKQKRPSYEIQTCTSPEGEHKKLRIEKVIKQEAHPNISPANNMPSPPDSDEPPIVDDRKSSVPKSEVRSEEECVNMIFEQDAEIPNGVFCSLCFDRFQAELIPEPPDVLVQPDFNTLLTHCMTMHLAVWGELRQKASS
ncbi:hypothetical protein JVU11DRAFT_1571 [Chiua virens]|nr:hypothetical protein JVU11DRAFT_1571 [Chiua virens]